MKAKIIVNKGKTFNYGELYLDKGLGCFQLQQCPLQQDGFPCGTWCPAFRWEKQDDHCLLYLCKNISDIPYVFKLENFIIEGQNVQ